MRNKKGLILLIGLIVVSFIGFNILNDEKKSTKVKEDAKTTSSSTVVNKSGSETKTIKTRKYDLYESSLYDLPLISIAEIAKLSPEMKKSIDNLLENAQGFFLLRQVGNKVFVILQTPVQLLSTYPRHQLQYAEVLEDGKIVYHNAGYVGYDGEADESNINESWVYDNSVDFKRPLRHISYDEKNKIKFVEEWSYSPEEQIKYIMKDSYGNIISIKKESQDNESNYRKEHVFYDNNGDTRISLTINYDGANISRLTFYNSHDSIESLSIISDYVDGIKTRESVYDEKYQLLYTVLPTYVDGVRKQISVFNSKGEEIAKLSS